MNKLPDFFKQSPAITELSSKLGLPISCLPFTFNKPDLSNFLPVYESMIDSGNLFKYEDYDYLHDARVANNLNECRNLYAKTDLGWQFLRRERIKTGQNLNFTVYNKSVGWFPEIKDNLPDLIQICDDFVARFGIDVWKILVFKVDQDLVWHQDMDGYYGFRLFMGQSDWTLRFKRIKPEFEAQLRKMTWMGQWNEVNDTMPQTCYDYEYQFSEIDTGQAFLINSMQYLHYFENTEPHYGVLIKGVV